MKLVNSFLAISATCAATVCADAPVVDRLNFPTTVPEAKAIKLRIVGAKGSTTQPFQRLMAAQKMVKAAYLGVAVTAADATLGEQLDLPPGVGLPVVSVEEGSPAAAAGVQVHDVLHKLDDQLLVNLQQLTTLVRTYKAGTEVKLTVIRKGKSQVLTATLAEREMPALADVLMPVQIEGLPAKAGMEQGLFKFNREALRLVPGAGGGEGGSDVKPRLIRLRAGGTSQVVREVNGERMELNYADGNRHITITGKDGTVLFEGPLNTDEERAKVPEALRPKVKDLEEGFELKLLPSTMPAEPKA